MADNVGYTPGTGATIAADDVDGVLYQRVKISTGEADTAVDVSESAPFPVTVIADESMATSQLLQYLDSPRGYDKSLQRQRVTAVVESGTVTTVSTVTAVTTVTTVTTVTGLTNIDTFQGRQLGFAANWTAWAQCVRSVIT